MKAFGRYKWHAIMFRLSLKWQDFIKF